MVNNLRQNADVKVASDDLLSKGFPNISEAQNQFDGYGKCRYEWLVGEAERDG